MRAHADCPTCRCRVLRCQAPVQPTWYRPKGGRCAMRASFRVKGKRVCRMHARVLLGRHRSEGIDSSEVQRL